MSIIFNTRNDWIASEDKPFIKITADDLFNELKKNVDKYIYLGNIEVNGDVELDTLCFNDSFFCGNAKFNRFSCRKATFNDEFYCCNAKFNDWFFCNEATFNRFYCGNAKFENRFSCDSAKFESWFSCNSATFNGFSCNEATFDRFYCDYATFKNGITTNGATLRGKKINFIKVVEGCGNEKRTVGLFNLEGENYLRIGCQFDKFDVLRQEVIEKCSLDNDYVKKIDGLLV